MTPPIPGKLTVVGAALLLSFSANAALSIRDLDGDWSNGHEGVYDDVLDITWLADANYAKTSGYNTNGYMEYPEVIVWADSVDIHGYDDWRLPITTDSGDDGATYLSSIYEGVDYGFNLTVHSEMSFLYYVALGNHAFEDTNGNQVVNGGLKNTGPFVNLEETYYWSQTMYGEFGDEIWFFDFIDGFQAIQWHLHDSLALLVHDGDIGAAVVPIPAAAWLFGSALAGLLVANRKRS